MAFQKRGMRSRLLIAHLVRHGRNSWSAR
jgi:hypothetical protein